MIYRDEYKYILRYYNVEQKADEMLFIVSPIIGHSDGPGDRHGRIDVEMGEIILSFPELMDKRARTTLLPMNKVEIGRKRTIEECYQLILYFIFKDRDKI